MNRETISVIILTYNESLHIARAIEVGPPIRVFPGV